MNSKYYMTYTDWLTSVMIEHGVNNPLPLWVRYNNDALFQTAMLNDHIETMMDDIKVSAWYVLTPEAVTFLEEKNEQSV